MALNLFWRNGGIKSGRVFRECMQQHLAACKLQQVMTSYLHPVDKQIFLFWSLSVHWDACLSHLLSTTVHVNILRFM